MSYEWDPSKAAINLHKHKIDFADAVAVLEDELAVTLGDDYPEEDRYVTIGMDAFGRVLVLVYTYREENIRIISARKAMPRECWQYELGL
ncbi:MAG: BrnT family toxin [Acidobacteriota bacterium]|nr:BrnT family toxin [Acidobacteriota bacterium]